MAAALQRARYLGWAALAALHVDRRCPACGNDRTALVRRKWLVTALYDCPACALRFRVPKDRRATSGFYERHYEQGFTTSPPGDAELDRLLRDGFAGHEKDYGPYIAVLRAAGIAPPATLLDFGASWGYGSWQFRQAGYEVFAYELSSSRRRFAATRLGVSVLDDPARPPAPVDCFFSAHVMEHLADPNEIWAVAAATLRPDGVFVAFMPNGEPGRESSEINYHRQWGQVHPLLITPRHLAHSAARHGFQAGVYSSPYPLDRVTTRASGGDLLGPELAVVAWRAAR